LQTTKANTRTTVAKELFSCRYNRENYVICDFIENELMTEPIIHNHEDDSEAHTCLKELLTSLLDKAFKGEL
jgi:hypothetical protein